MKFFKKNNMVELRVNKVTKKLLFDRIEKTNWKSYEDFLKFKLEKNQYNLDFNLNHFNKRDEIILLDMKTRSNLELVAKNGIDNLIISMIEF